MRFNTAPFQRYLLLAFSAAIIFWMGRLSWQYQLHGELSPVQPILDSNQSVPLITIEDLTNAQLSGIVNLPEIRLRSGDQIAIPDAELRFTLDLQHLGFLGPQRPIIEHRIPEWAEFVASKKGKYFYALDEKSAKNLNPATRVYFSTAEEARASGYLSRSR